MPAARINAIDHRHTENHQLVERRRRRDAEDRIAWMLRVNRLHGPDERHRNMFRFATDFRGIDRVSVAKSQVSRWESAQTGARYDVLRGYELTLELPPDTLVAVADGLFRFAMIEVGPSHLDRKVDRTDAGTLRRLDSLLERALSADLMTGGWWDDLTTLLTSKIHVFLRQQDWISLVERLLMEELISDGYAWRQRHESVNRLLWLPQSRPHLIAACAALGRDASNQIFIEPLAMLDTPRDVATVSVLIEQLTNPTNDQALRGALLATTNKIRYGHFSPSQLRSIGSLAIDRLLDTASPAVWPSAAEVVRLASPDDFSERDGRLRRALGLNRDLINVLRSGRTTGVDVANTTASRLGAQAIAQMPGTVDTSSGAMVYQLIDEILHSPNLDVRVYAAQLLGATPFRTPVADALCAELRRPAVARSGAVAPAILAALPLVGSAQHRATVETILLADGLPPSVANSAAWNIGHLPGESADAFWRAALERHRAAWQQRRSDSAESTLRGLVYALGTTRHTALIADVARDDHMPPAARAAARWWRRLPRAVRDSARQ